MLTLPDIIAQAYDFLHAHAGTAYTMYPWLIQLNAYRVWVQTIFDKLAWPMINKFINTIRTKPDIASIALLLVTLYISLKLLNMAIQSVMWWLKLARKLMFWALIVGVGTWVWSRGLEGAVTDLGTLGQTFKTEYAYWNERAERARIENAINGKGRVGSRGR